MPFAKSRQPTYAYPAYLPCLLYYLYFHGWTAFFGHRSMRARYIFIACCSVYTLTGVTALYTSSLDLTLYKFGSYRRRNIPPSPPTSLGNDQQVVVSTDQGDLYLFNNMEFRGALPSAPDDGSAICNLAAFSKGFVAGGSSGALRVYERSEDPREFFKCLKVAVFCVGICACAFFTLICFLHPRTSSVRADSRPSEIQALSLWP